MSFLVGTDSLHYTMNTDDIRQSAIDDFLTIVKTVSVWGIKYKFGSNVDRAFRALFTGDYQEIDHFNFAFEIPQSLLKSIFQKHDPESKQTVCFKYEEIISELETKGTIVRFKHGAFMQNKKHACSRFLLNADELKRIFADGEEIKRILRYWTEDSIYTIRQQKLLLKHIARKRQMTDKTEQDKQDTQVFINENKMRIERNRRLGRAKAKRTRIQELTENVEQLTKLVTMLVANQGIQQEPTGSFRDFTEEEKKKLMVPMPNPTIDNSDIPEDDEEDELTPEQKAYAEKIWNDPRSGWKSEEEMMEQVRRIEFAVQDMRRQAKGIKEEVDDSEDQECVKEASELSEQDKMLNKMSFKERAEWANRNIFGKV